VTTGYGKQAAVADVALAIEPGEFVAVVGPNGAGKTTLVNVLSGLLPCWSGRLTWDGRDLTRSEPHERVQLGLATVPQAAPAFMGLSVARNLEVAASVRGPGLDGMLPVVLELFPELRPKQLALARTLSGGQRQMLALARAMCQSPRLLLLDEPSFGLAVGVRHRVVGMLRRYREKVGCSVLMVEQDVSMIEGADRVFFMNSGRIERVR
jgi:branched-chain amino acid transport system ATP-binding protein